MSSSFWEGKTCGEMRGLHVKVTYESGATLEGVTNNYGDIPKGDDADAIHLSPNRIDSPFVPYDFIKSIELLDDPEYERIDDVHDVCVGDVFVATNGNKFSVVAVDDDDETDCPLAVMVQGEAPDFHVWMFNSNFSHALRRKPKLPDHDGLWYDKDGFLWRAYEDASKIVCIDTFCSSPTFGTLIYTSYSSLANNENVKALAPFRPAKVVEA